MFKNLFRNKAISPAAQQGQKATPTIDMFRAWIDICLAQADTLARLGRHEDVAKKFASARAISLDCHKANPNSALDLLLAAEIAIASGQWEFADRMLSTAKSLQADERIKNSIIYNEHKLIKEREIAGGSLIAMVKHLYVHTCIKCGALVEFISIPCISCGWRPTTLLDACYSARLCNIPWSVDELLSIGREINLGRNVIDVVGGIADHVAEDMANPEALPHKIASNALLTASEKKDDDYFAWRDAATCKTCRQYTARHDSHVCKVCQTPLRLPAPLRLLLCLNRLMTHFLHNLEVKRPGSTWGEDRAQLPSSEVELFVIFLCTLQSKLYREQDTPTDRERLMVLTFMANIKRLEIKGALGAIVIAEPERIVAQLKDGLSHEDRSRAELVLIDARDSFQYLADWMRQPKALC